MTAKKATHVAPTRVAVVQAIDSRKTTGMRATPTHSLGALTSIIAGKSPMNGRERERYIYIIYNGSLKGEIIIIIKIYEKHLGFFQQAMFEYQRVRENFWYRRFLPWPRWDFLEVIPRVVVDEKRDPG